MMRNDNIHALRLKNLKKTQIKKHCSKIIHTQLGYKHIITKRHNFIPKKNILKEKHQKLAKLKIIRLKNKRWIIEVTKCQVLVNNDDRKHRFCINYWWGFSSLTQLEGNEFVVLFAAPAADGIVLPAIMALLCDGATSGAPKLVWRRNNDPNPLLLLDSSEPLDETDPFLENCLVSKKNSSQIFLFNKKMCGFFFCLFFFIIVPVFYNDYFVRRLILLLCARRSNFCHMICGFFLWEITKRNKILLDKTLKLRAKVPLCSLILLGRMN